MTRVLSVKEKETLKALDDTTKSIDSTLNKIDLSIWKTTASKLNSLCNNLEKELAFFKSDDFLQVNSYENTAALKVTKGTIVAKPTKLKFNGDILYTIKFNNEWITTQNKEKEVLFDTESNEAFKPLGVYVKGKEVYIKISSKSSQTSKSSIQIYPNPSSNIVTVTGANDNSKYILYNLNGQLLESDNLINGKLSIEKFTNGLYILNIGNVSKTIIKKD